ncbi:outer membrane beta-barrel protein [Labilibaculum sp. A4]|uniref:outer membrane beta-barrel protein n=1 Tax=Labilibaculum euxinus TaxID=2686357 RepID=UPI000F62807D|nr:outer membrane beta-barrel protein [Labilibaculum euxinus]MDQ1771870.1 outer membrane beta-barrel protein [Labilibaculum euxinus]MWN77775.1 outer membrane beta-barrel protein [Labilibaculum euxinus]
MLKDNKHMDSLFADGLKNLSVPPNPKVWEGINSQLMAAKKKRLFAIYMWTGVAASILLLLVIGNHYFSGQSNYNMQLNTLSENSASHQNDSVRNFDQQIDSKTNSSTKKELTNNVNTSDELYVSENKQEEIMIADKVSHKPNLGDANSPEIFNNGNTSSLLSKFPDSNGTEIRASKLNTAFLSNKKDLAFLDSEFVNGLMNRKTKEKLSNFEYDLPSQLVPNTSQLAKQQDLVLLADEIQIQKNILAIEQLGHDKNKENRWSIIGQVSSSYSSYSGDSKGGNAGSGIWSVGGGAKVNYAMNEKLAVQTGIVYNRFGQDMSARGGSRDGLMYADPIFGSDENFVNNEVVLTRTYPEHTAAGPIKLSGGSNLPMTAASGDKISSSYSPSSSEDLIQSFKSIEIPLLMRYNLIQKRVGMFVSGGLSANMIVGNGVYDQSQGNKKIGEIDGIRTTNFSSQFSFGLEYRLNSKLQIGLEPSVKYYLNSISTSNQYDYKPYSIGIFTGIRYDF